MSYSRWSTSMWYTYWRSQDKATENRDTAIFAICAEASFTAKQLRENMDECISSLENLDKVSEVEIEELRGYMETFLRQVDKKYPQCDRCSAPHNRENPLFCSNENCCYHIKNRCPHCGNPSWYDERSSTYFCACICDGWQCNCNWCGAARRIK